MSCSWGTLTSKSKICEGTLGIAAWRKMAFIDWPPCTVCIPAAAVALAAMALADGRQTLAAPWHSVVRNRQAVAPGMTACAA